MQEAFQIAALWLGLAVLATIIASHLRISMALVEICVGMAAAFVANQFAGDDALRANQDCLRFIASIGAVLLTFLAGAELDPAVIRTKWKEVMLVGAVYAVMLESGFNQTEFGKGILGACFINDLGTVIALGVLFAPFTYRTVIFIVVTVLVLGLLPLITARLTAWYGNLTAAIRTKWILLVLCGLGALALWSGNEAVLPAYLAGIVLAKNVGRDNFYIRRLRTLPIGFLTPFYFLRAGSLVSLPALAVAPWIFLILLAGKVASKIFGLLPIIGMFRRDAKERWYYTLLMSTGLTFGTISALYGLTHELVSPEQYSFLVAAVIASAVIPTMIANAFFLPRHLLPETPMADDEIPQLETALAGSPAKPSDGLE